MLVEEAAELEAAARVADRHVVGIDHAEQLGARGRLAEHAQSTAGPMLDCSAAGTVLRSEPSKRTFMELESDSDVGLTPEFQLAMRRARAVTGRGSEARRNAMREREVVLQFALTSTAPPL